jgi:hypothetical protein
MASSLLKNAGAKRVERKKLEKAGDADRDPAVPDLPDTPSWDSPPAGEEASAPASDSASGKAGGNDSGKAPAGSRPPRRRGRPRGPDRVRLSVRIRTDLDDQLSEAVARTDMSPQYIVEAALERHFKHLGIKSS